MLFRSRGKKIGGFECPLDGIKNGGIKKIAIWTLLAWDICKNGVKKCTVHKRLSIGGNQYTNLRIKRRKRLESSDIKQRLKTIEFYFLNHHGESLYIMFRRFKNQNPDLKSAKLNNQLK